MRDCILEAGAIAILSRIRRDAMFGPAPPVNGNPDTIAADVDILTGRDHWNAPVTGRTRAAVHAAADRIRSECPPADTLAPAPEDVAAAIDVMVRAYERNFTVDKAAGVRGAEAAAIDRAEAAIHEAIAMALRAVGDTLPKSAELRAADTASARAHADRKAPHGAPPHGPDGDNWAAAARRARAAVKEAKAIGNAA